MLRQKNPTSSWNVLVYRVTGEGRQQEILRAFHQIDDLGVVALGTSDGDSCFVVIDCPTLVSRVAAGGVIGTIDPSASVTYRSHAGSAPPAWHHV